MLSNVSEYLPIEINLRFLELGDELGVADTMLSSGGIDFDLPEPPEVPLFLFSVCELECPGVEESFFCLAVLTLTGPLKAFGML